MPARVHGRTYEMRMVSPRFSLEAPEEGEKE
jgi:hypothetical protein